MVQSEFWQAPGNRKCFDSTLEEWKTNEMSKRSIGVLKFIEDRYIVSENDFKEKIADYLEEEYELPINNSDRGHFFRPIQFVEFIVKIDDNLLLSLDGKSFLKEIKKGNYEKALDYYLFQLFRTSFPNNATKKCNLGLFPFRIMFKLFDEYNSIHNKLFLTKIPFITSYEDILEVRNVIEDENYINYLNRHTITKIQEDLNLKESHKKWRSWVLLSLVDVGILEKEGNGYNFKLKLSENKKDFIHNIVKDMSYRDMFFESEEDFDDIKNKTSYKKRNPAITNKVLKETNYTCFFDSEHKTFSSKTRPNYVEGHHIIHLSYQNNFVEDLDCEDNIIALCPNCHKAIHLSNEDHKKKLCSFIIENNMKFKKFDQKVEDLMALSYNKSSKK